ncbi:hypothetical protein HMPREF1121_00238 [Porphyromonas sp. KLE 1280]|nr:hypothetical protein HMPREF1121_00238 [Porphyromonas sp. KLE 1280]
MFQFTHPGRGATGYKSLGNIKPKFQFTHPGRGATDNEAILSNFLVVSIHAPREGCDARKMIVIIS